MEQSGRWRPLLDGELAAEAWQAVREVAEALREPSAAAAADPTLASGSAGIALFHTYLAQALSEDAWADAAANHFDRMVEAVPSAPLRPGLFGGLVGIGWTIEHLRGRLFAADAEEEDDNQEIDEALLPALLRAWTGDYDLLRGLVGIGVYFHERLSRPAARPAAETALRRILVQLMNSVEESDGGLTWHTSPELLPQEVRDSHPQGYYNVGMAHGVPGVIALLGLLCEAGFDQSGSLDSDARPLLAGAVDWLLARELPPEAATRFPHLAGPGIAPAPSRLAWCYGDPAIAVALLGAARRSGNTEWERAARRIALDAAARSPEGSRVIDAGLCHGAAGLGHLFHRLHQATGEEALAGAARFWFRQALDLRRPGEGVAGFLAWAPLPNGEEGWDADPGFLTGASGVALALLAALSPIEPAWDRLLMVSIPDQETDVS